jgi:two-component system CheB/CheR fusion protein
MPAEKKRIKSNRPKKKIKAFPIIGIGASAGGLDAIGSFFDAMPDEFPDMAFVVVSHLDPSHSSILPDLLQKRTRMEVRSVNDGINVQPHRVYVIPPDRDLRIENGRLRLTQFHPLSSPRAPINHFFRSLAEQQAERAVGIILSGMGSDGTIGIQCIKGELGMVMVQEPASAKYDGMPQSAIHTGLADFVLPPEEMPEHLVRYVDRMLKGEPVPAEKMSSEALKKIHTILRTSTGHDFSYYKNSTVQRRIGRRMNIHGIENPSEYVRYLQKDPQEATSLIKELLIGVTSFFRDPEAFESLKKTGLPKLVENKPDGDTLRAWVAGCATGEEAYPLGIILREYMDEHRPDMNIQIFATDLDEDAVQRARAGLYAGDIATDVNSKRLKMFFKKENNGYKVRAGIRESIVFAQQSVIKDPPFTKLDLICCRNLLIYLDSELQKRLLPLFHHSLNPEGILFLGTSETIGEFTTLFSSLNDKWKIYQRKAGTHSRLQPMDFPFPLPKHEPQGVPIKKYMDITALAERTLLDGHTPPAMIIDANGDIRYIHGRMHKYLEHAQGPIRSYNAFEMAREGLKIHLIATMRKIRPESVSIKKDIQIEQDGHILDVRVTIGPMPREETRGLYMVVFEEVSKEKRQKPKQTVKVTGKDNLAARNQALEQELNVARDKLRTTVEELESSNEELRSANEEYQSANEELQSANEELNSSKEELQSLNEELETVNSELQGKVQQIEKAYDEMSNMLNSLDLPPIFLDDNLCIRRFSASAERIVELLETDVGRPFKQLSSKVLDVDLVETAQHVLDSMCYVEKEVQTQNGQVCLMRVLPYPHMRNQRLGVVFTFVNIKELKGMTKKLQFVEDAWRFAEGIVETVRDPLIVLDQNMKIITASKSFHWLFHIAEKTVEGKSLYDLVDGQLDIPELRKVLEEVLPKGQSFEDLEIECQIPGIGRKKLRLNARRIHEQGVAKDRILLAMEQVTQEE